MKLLNRDSFRESVFSRDGKCVWCGNPYQDAHHLIERRLFEDGGYYLDNGVSLCGPCHLKAESTEISPKELRLAAGINTIVLPEHLAANTDYDKWGNQIIGNYRIKGELFDDESVQKVIKDFTHLFIDRIKYPRTFHLPWSKTSGDDKRLQDTSCFEGVEVVVLEKMDGENTTIYKDCIHARSVNSKVNATRSWVAQLQANIADSIPEGFRICGENLFARHTVPYEELESYFLVFSIWDGMKCLSWKDTKEYCDLLGLKTVPEIFEGTFTEDIKNLKVREDQEGYVVRKSGEFYYKDFKTSVAKYVSPTFIIPDEHWTEGPLVKNQLKKI